MCRVSALEVEAIGAKLAGGAAARCCKAACRTVHTLRPACLHLVLAGCARLAVWPSKAGVARAVERVQRTQLAPALPSLASHGAPALRTLTDHTVFDPLLLGNADLDQGGVACCRRARFPPNVWVHRVTPEVRCGCRATVVTLRVLRVVAVRMRRIQGPRLACVAVDGVSLAALVATGVHAAVAVMRSVAAVLAERAQAPAVYMLLRPERTPASRCSPSPIKPSEHSHSTEERLPTGDVAMASGHATHALAASAH
eukprot:1034100-Rhodomonas_salina.5